MLRDTKHVALTSLQIVAELSVVWIVSDPEVEDVSTAAFSLKSRVPF